VSEPAPIHTDAYRRGLLRCGAAAVLFGATAPIASRLADDTTAPALAGLLYLGAAVAVLPFALRKPVDVAAARIGLGRLGIAVLVGGFLGPLLFAAGLSRTPAATASLLLNLELVATIVLAALLFHEHIGRRVDVGTAFVVAAGVVLVWTDSPELRLGALLIVGACICWGLDNCVTADLDQIAPEHVTLAKGVIAGGTNFVLGVALGAAIPSLGVVVGALLVGAFGYGASITLWVTGARDLGAARGQLVFATAPFIGVLVAWAVLGDPVRSAEVISVVLAAVGVSRVVGSGHLHKHHHQPLEHDHEHTHDDGHHRHTHRAGLDTAGRHTHRHRHDELVHAHPHVPDLHHRHEH
jgi:drug/metabolite transporter (DMT)-like permease